MLSRSPSSRFTVKTRRVQSTFAAAVLAFTLSAGVCPLIAQAGDLDSAKQALEKVKNDVNSESWDNVQADIKSTEDFLDGLPASDKDPVQKELDGLKTKADAGLKDYNTKQVLDVAKSNLDHAADELSDSPLAAENDIEKATNLLTSDAAKKYVDPAAVDKLMNRARSLQKMASAKDADGKIANAKQILDGLDTQMAGKPFDNITPDNLDSVSRDVTSQISRIRGALEGVPADDPRVVAINAKLDGYNKIVTVAAGAAGAKDAEANFDRLWKSQQEYFAGWADEKPGTTWDDYVHKSSDLNSNLNMPKTVELMTRMHGWLTEPAVKDITSQYPDDPAIKAQVVEAQKTYDTAAAKLDGAFNDIMGQAEKGPMPNDNVFREQMDALANRADMWFKDTQYHDKDVARAQAITAKWNGTINGIADAQAAAMKNLTAQATAAWPAIAGAMKAEDGFTPDKLDQFKGKTIHLTGNNRLGWDYMPGAYSFAQDINGMAIAGKFSPQVAAAVKAANKQTGQESLPDESWDLYAVVQGPGKIDKIVNATGKVTVDGENVGTVSTERHDTVDCAVVQIIALHAGPVAVGPNGSAQGSIAPVGGDGILPAGSAAPGNGGPDHSAPVATASSPVVVAGGSSVLKTLEHLFECALCLTAAGLVMLKVKSPALTPATAGGAAPLPLPISDDSMALAGVALAALGVLWLLASLIVRDLIPAGLLVLSGAYAGSSWLKARNLNPNNMLDAITPFALPMAGATALFGILHIFIGNWYLV